MKNQVETHYTSPESLVHTIAAGLERVGKNIHELKTLDLAPIDEFHIRGRKATLELAARMKLDGTAKVLDIGSGLGGPARTLAEAYGCHVTGIDLTASFCEAATKLSHWVGLANKVRYLQADATNVPFADDSFNAAMTIHVAMNIVRKDLVYRHAKRVLKRQAIFAVYDILQGEGGPVHFPVPWARNPSISHLATPADMRVLLSDAGFQILEEIDSSDEGLVWFKEMTARMAAGGPRQLSTQLFLGADFPQMAQNQVRNLSERRIRTLSYICQA